MKEEKSCKYVLSIIGDSKSYHAGGNSIKELKDIVIKYQQENNITTGYWEISIPLGISCGDRLVKFGVFNKETT